MRINVKTNEPNKVQNMGTLQTWIEAHPDEQIDFFAACQAKKTESLVFEFVYTTVLGCNRLFIYDPIDEELLSFFAEDFTDIGNWIFKRCDEYFGGDYTIML